MSDIRYKDVSNSATITAPRDKFGVFHLGFPSFAFDFLELFFLQILFPP